MTIGGLDQSQANPGDRGLTTIRHMSKAQFEKVYNNIAGFEDAYLCWSNHKAWGAIDQHGNRVLEVFINLDLVENSYAIDRAQDKPLLVINDAFIDRIKWIFYVFYDQDKSQDYTENSSLEPEFLNKAELDWRTPEVIVIYIHFKIDGQEQVFPILENATEWQSEGKTEFGEGPVYIDQCSQRYTAFLNEYMKSFDANGNLLSRG